MGDAPPTPSVQDLTDWTNQLKKFKQDMPGDILKQDQKAVNVWLAAAENLAHNLREASNWSQGLTINENLFGENLDSARSTAHNLNETSDGIRQKLAAYVAFADQLHDTMREAFLRIKSTDEPHP